MAEQKLVLQASALPVRNGKICLVTNSSGRRWILPKGHVPEGVLPPVLAACEAWEEAGLLGSISAEPCCRYREVKMGRNYDVTVYLLEVTRCVSDWPERKSRRRQWVSIREAILLLKPKIARRTLQKLEAWIVDSVDTEGAHDDAA